MIIKRFVGALLLSMGLATFTQAQTSAPWQDTFLNAIPSITQGSASFQPNYPTPGYPDYNPYPQDWRLGVGINNTDTGAVVTQVEPGSAAAAVGIRVNDIIVAAGGARIGRIDGRINDIANEIRRSATPQGQINLVVFDSYNRTLRSVIASLQTQTSSFPVSVALRDAQALPYGSMLTVKLKNLTNPYYEIPGGTQTINVSGLGPYAINFNIDPRYVTQGHTYELSAYITSYNQYTYILSRPITVSSADFSRPKAVTLDRWTGSGTGTGTGTNINVGYPNLNANPQLIQKIFRDYLSREPSQSELYGWLDYLNKGHSIDDLKVGILTSPQFRDRFGGDDSQFIVYLFQSFKNRVPTSPELSALITRLQTTNSPDFVAREIINSYK